LLCYIPEHKWFKRFLRILSVIAVLLVALSATPLPMWAYIIWGAIWLLWVLFDGLAGKASVYLRLLLILSCAGAVAWELPYHRAPDLSGAQCTKLYVVGDSIAAGIGEAKRLWPTIVREDYGVPTTSLASGSALVSDGIVQARQIPDGKYLVLLEIGGNDMLRKTDYAQFEKNLDELLSVSKRGGHTVVMMELPLIIGRNRYGQIQRSLARKHGVAMIPKRFFARAMSEEQARTDGIHLSDIGHEGMAKMIWELIGEGLVKKPKAPASGPAGG
jgi:acyl-CoA thioesterase-1